MCRPSRWHTFFEFVVQVHHGTFWLTIAEFDMSINCPLSLIMEGLGKNKRIEGGYGLEHSVLPLDIDHASFISTPFAETDFFNKPDKDESPSKDGEDESEEENDYESEEENDDESDDEYGSESKKKVLFHCSTDQFENLLQSIESYQSSKYDPVEYVHTLHLVVNWCNMALTALPLDHKVTDLSNVEEGEITNLFEKKQAEMLDLYKKSLAETLSECILPLELVHLIAEYAVGGKDVRVVFNDDERYISGFPWELNFGKYKKEKMRGVSLRRY